MKRHVRQQLAGAEKGNRRHRHLNIRGKILSGMMAVVLAAMAALGGISIWLNISSTQDTLEQTMTELAQVAADRVEQELQSNVNVAVEAGCVARLASADVSVADKRAIISQRAQTHGYQRGNLLDRSGRSLFDGNDYSDRDYYQHAIKGDVWVSEPLVSKVTGELTIIVAAPLWQGGIPDTQVVGVVYFVPPETFLNDIVAGLQVSAGGSAYILNREGTTIAHKNMDNVKNRENTAQDAKTDPALKSLAALEAEMTQGKSGFGTYTYGGVSKFLAYSPLSKTDGWSIGVNAPVQDFMGSTNRGIFLTVLLTLAALAVAFLLALRLANGIGKPVAACTRRLELLAEGDLESPVPQLRSRDEIGRLAEATATITTALSAIVTDIDYGLDEMAHGNFQVESNAIEYFKGDFAPIGKAMYNLMDHMSETLAQVNEAAEQVNAGAGQVSTGSQALAQGAAEQASSVEELAATISDISGQVQENAENAAAANQAALDAKARILSCNQEMQEMIAAMAAIDSTSQEIEKILSTIENIAFQTNILALNAAVEAARAGEAGKGFAVVADEVRSLANKSQEASKDTAALIERSIQAVRNGTKIAGETAQAMDSTVEGVQSITSTIGQISQASETQAATLQQVTVGVDQISSVVQTNSATAEESAAASEELSGQAQMLKDLVSRFKLRRRQ